MRASLSVIVQTTSYMPSFVDVLFFNNSIKIWHNWWSITQKIPSCWLVKCIARLSNRSCILPSTNEQFQKQSVVLWYYKKYKPHFRLATSQWLLYFLLTRDLTLLATGQTQHPQRSDASTSRCSNSSASRLLLGMYAPASRPKGGNLRDLG